MGIKSIYSTKSTVEAVVQDLSTQAKGLPPKMVLYFASSIFDPEALSSQMQAKFKDSCVFGCTTAGEIVSGRMLKKSVVVMLFSQEVVSDVKVTVVEDISHNNRVPEAFKEFEAYFHTPMSKMDARSYVGMILIDGLSRAEEKVMEKIGDLTSVQFIGGSAGDDAQFKKTYVYANGKAYTNAALLAVLKPVKGFDFIKTQSFAVLDPVLTATKVDEPNRVVLEFNHKPALAAYAEALGMSIAEARNQFMEHPLGLMVEDEPFVRSPQQTDNSGITFYCNIREGMDLSVLVNTAIVKETKQAIMNKEKEIGKIQGLVNFHCILRTLELEKKGLSGEYGQIFKDIPTVGFSTYGEEYIGHINQTSTMLVFK